MTLGIGQRGRLRNRGLDFEKSMISSHDKLIESWIKFTCSDQGSDVRDELLWAYEKFVWASEEDPELCLDLIVGVLSRESQMPVIGALAAGPMEDVLVNFGPRIIDRVEVLAAKNDQFRTMLGGVWCDDIDPCVRKRLEALRENEW